MRKLFIYGNIFFLSLLGDRLQAEDSIKVLSQKVIQVATAEVGISDEAKKITKELVLLDHNKVIEAMLPLLKHEKKGVPKLASYLIRECKRGLKPEHFEQLKAGYQNGGGWLPGAIASLGTDEAAKFLVLEFRKNPQIHGQIDWALISMGEIAVPFLMEEFDDADLEKEEKFFDGVCHLFKGTYGSEGMKRKGRSAIPHLLNVAESVDLEVRRRQQAIVTIGCIGKAAELYFPRLRKLAEKDPENFKSAVNQAISISETTTAAVLLANGVDNGAGYYSVRKIAVLGHEAKSLGPRVEKWLTHADWEVRVMAARTLGAIGYKDSRVALEKLLTAQSDWRLAYAATRALAELEMKESVKALENASREHWFPIVRLAAEEAVTAISGNGKVEHHGGTEFGNLVDWVFIDRDSLSIDRETFSYFSAIAPTKAKRMSYTPFMQANPELAEKFVNARKTSGAEMLGHFGSVITFAVNKGLLIGVAAGEWCGGLHYAPDQGEYRALLEENISGIECWKGRYFVSSGTYHMGMNEGIIHEVIFEDGRARLEPWFVLPGQPLQMWQTRKGEMVITCIGGAVVFSSEKKFKYYSGQANSQ